MNGDGREETSDVSRDDAPPDSHDGERPEGDRTSEAGGETGDRDGDASGPPVALSPATKASLLWAAIGGLTFLVLIQGFELWSGQRVSVPVKFAVAGVVAVAAGAATYVLQGRLPAPNESA